MREMASKHMTLLAVCLALQSSALAVDFAGGTGEPNDPYQIATAEQLVAIGSDPNLMDKNFVLAADIDLDPNLPGGRVFTDALIAQDDDDGVGSHGGRSFEGVLDGRGYTISNLHIEGVHGYDAGLFGKLSGLVKDLRLTDVVVSGSPCGAIAGLNHRAMILRCEVTGRISGADRVGGLVGDNWDASIAECHAQVQVSGGDNVGGIAGGGAGGTLIRCRVQAEVSGNHSVGGLVGHQGDNQVVECRATGIVIGNNNVGGLIGDAYRATVLRSSASCEVIAEQTAGGLIGNARLSAGPLMADCYAIGSVAGSVVGGLTGDTHRGQILNCYAACEVVSLQADGKGPLAGGLIGDVGVVSWAPMAISCFWDAELSGITESTGSHPLELATGLTTQQMLDEKVLQNAGWDFGHVWMACEGDYPRLQWEIEDFGDQGQ